MAVPFQTASGWRFPDDEDEPLAYEEHLDQPGGNAEEEQQPKNEESEKPTPTTPPKFQRVYPTRTCRICLEEVPPTLEPLTGGIPSILHPAPKVTYISSDPSSGRLIRPCKCRGSQQYVHEGCLQEWRHADPSYGQRNFWECPTCKFKYRLERMKWSRAITSKVTQIVITLAIMITTIFIFGFVADPIISLYLDPYETITSLPTTGTAGLLEDEDNSWALHFIKGLTSLGLLGFVKVFFAMSPWHWWNLRQTGVLGGGGRRRGGTGRERMEDISWTIVIIGVVTFLAAVWTWVRAWTARTLEIAGEQVADVQGEDENDFQEAETEETHEAQAGPNVSKSSPSTNPADPPQTTESESRKRSGFVS